MLKFIILCPACGTNLQIEGSKGSIGQCPKCLSLLKIESGKNEADWWAYSTMFLAGFIIGWVSLITAAAITGYKLLKK